MVNAARGSYLHTTRPSSYASGSSGMPTHARSRPIAAASLLSLQAATKPLPPQEEEQTACLPFNYREHISNHIPTVDGIRPEFAAWLLPTACFLSTCCTYFILHNSLAIASSIWELSFGAGDPQCSRFPPPLRSGLLLPQPERTHHRHHLPLPPQHPGIARVKKLELG